MNANWQEYSLDELCIKITDGSHQSPKAFKDGKPMFSVKDMTENGFTTSGVKKISNEDYLRLISQGCKPEINDILVAKDGSVMKHVFKVENNIEGVLLSSIAIIRPNKEKVDPDFLVFSLLNPSVKNDILSNYVSGSGVPRIVLKDFKKITLRIPDIETQRKIARVLISINKKSFLNTQTNQTLEQIAQAIFKSWFVDFEPVKAKMAVLEAGGTAEQAELAAMSVISGKDEAALKQLQAEHPDRYQELAETAALFPSVMVESELGEIPEGWEPSNLKSCTTELRRGISPKYTEENGIRVINQKCIRNHTIDFTLARRNDPSKRKIEGREIEIGDVLVNSTGVGTLGRLAPVRHLDETTVVDSHVTVVRADTIKISKSFLSGLMIENESFIEASGAGSTGQTELRKQVLEDIVFTRPSPEIDNKFDLIVRNMNSQIAALEKQCATLASTRDSLLPKLLAGDLPIPSTEEA